MKALRILGITCLCFTIFLLTLGLTSLSFSYGWMYGILFLFIIWLVYFFCLLLKWEFLGTLGFVAFIGYATGLLKESDKFTTERQAEILSYLPYSWIGYIGLAFYFIFIVIFVGLAGVISERITKDKVEVEVKKSAE